MRTHLLQVRTGGEDAENAIRAEQSAWLADRLGLTRG